MRLKKVLKILCTVTIILTVSTQTVSASEIENITVLGDSISAGYGLSENESNYSVWLGDYYNASIENFAANGKTTVQLLESLESDPDIKESVRQADLVCVSIGGNDILQIFYNDLVNIADDFSSSPDGGFNFSPEAIQKIIVSFSSALGPASAEAGKNISKIADSIYKINPNAETVFQTVYNPFETNIEEMKSVYAPLYTFTSIYLGVINNEIRNTDGIVCADIHEKFKGNCPDFTNIQEMDIHPNRLGHLIIAEEITEMLKIPGNGSIFKKALNEFDPQEQLAVSEKIKTEINELSNGSFREDPDETELTSENSSYTSQTQISEEKQVAAVTKFLENPEVPSKRGRASVITAFIIAVVLTVIIIVAIVRKNINRNRNKKIGERS